MRHSVVERLRFIDARLFWDAKINRSDLINRFAVSPAQSAADFREYLAQSPSGVHYDTRAKAYVATSEFEPVFGKPDARAELERFLVDGDPLVAELARLERPIDPTHGASRRAARDGQKIRVQYQSFTQPNPSWRWIAPSRLVSDGQRWHVRAWCYREQQWKDFVLARILDINEAEAAELLPPDYDWIETITLVLLPAEHLSKGQKTSVMREFAMRSGRLVATVPRAMKIYAVRRWGLDRPEARLRLVGAEESKKLKQGAGE
ncbi:MAG: WYL domain-containing protein [Hyphomicrobium sp.]